MEVFSRCSSRKFRLPGNGREVSGRDVIERSDFRKRRFRHRIRNAERCGVPQKKFAALPGGKGFKKELHVKAPQRRLIERLDEVGGRNKDPFKIFHLREDFVNLRHLPAVPGAAPILQKRIGFID